MRTNHKPCPKCGGEMHRQSKLCRHCSFTDEWRAKLSAARKGQPSYVRTDEWKAKMSVFQTGRKHEWKSASTRPEVAAKIRNWWTPERREAARVKGKAQAADTEWRLRIAEALSGDKNPRWLGGVANSKYAPGFDKTLKRNTRTRDKHRCQLCGTTEKELGYRLTSHHIDYDKSNHDPLNLVSVCKRCNSLVNTNREVWEAHFSALLEGRGKFGEDKTDFVGRKVISQREGFISIREVDAPDLADLF